MNEEEEETLNQRHTIPEKKHPSNNDPDKIVFEDKKIVFAQGEAKITTYEDDKRYSDNSGFDVWLDDRMRGRDLGDVQFQLEGRKGDPGQRQRDLKAIIESERNKTLDLPALLMKYGKGNPGATRVLMDTLAKYGQINFWCFVYDLDKKGVYGSDIWRRFKEENEEDLSKFVKSIWSGAQAVIDDIDSGKSEPS